MNLPRGARTLYAAQTICVDFHSSPDDGAFASLPQNENSYITNLTSFAGKKCPRNTSKKRLHGALLFFLITLKFNT